MTKYILGLLLTTTLSYASLVNAIAIIINDTPITLYDIDLKMVNENLTKQQAIEKLMDETLYNQELKKHNITVDIFDIDNHIKRLAKQNNMDTLDFKSLVRQQQNYELFTLQIRKQLLHQKLISKIAKGKLKIANDEDMKIYYENNKNIFKIADTIDLIAYVSKSKKLLNQLKTNPMLQNEDIIVQKMRLKQSELTPQVKYILNSTNKKEFSVVFAQNKNYNMFFITNKSDVKSLSYKNVKEQIFNSIMKIREQNYLKEYFETLKITANIQILK
ncbi:MAG: peptidyl-prolyl cis-trans isomerase [Campylobacterota bacterium]|nr:peptidyl-prolyl cis-trans isomerase [Campylobacterota bacterium]